MPDLSPGPRHHEWSPAPPRYVALDVDGTLVGPDGRVAEEVVAACDAARAAGLHAGLATGRMALAVDDVLARTGLVGPHVLHNGAEVRLDGEVVHATPVEMSTAAAVVDTAVERGMYIEIYTDDGFVVTAEDHRAADHWTILGHEPDGVVVDGAALAQWTTMVPKVTAIAFERSEVDGIVAMLRELGLAAGPAGSPVTPHLMYVNGTDPAADKGSALTAAARAIGCDLAAVVALGDAGNDLPLLRVAGTAIAMGQAEDEVRAAAHLVAPSVTSHGAASVLHAAIGGFADVRRAR